MSIKVERNNNGNCVVFRGQTNPVYFNACLTAVVTDTDYVSVINDIATNGGDPVYEYYRIHYSEWINRDSESFPDAAAVVAYINKLTNTISIASTFGPDSTDVLDVSLNGTNTGVLFSTGDSFILGGVRAVVNDDGRIDIRQHTGDVAILADIPIANFEIESTPITGTATQVADQLNAYLQGEVNLFSPPDLTSLPSQINILTTESLNFRVNSDPAAPIALEFEWSGIPAGVYVSETYRGRLLGTPTAGVGTYTVTLTAFNSFGSDSKDIDIVVSAPAAFDNTKSTLLEPNYWAETDVADAAALQGILGNGSFVPWTISFWVKPNANGNPWQNLIVFGQSADTDSRVNIAWNGRQDQVMLRCGEVADNWALLRTANNAMSPGVWHHVVVTHSSSLSWDAGSVDLWIDGVNTALIADSSSSTPTPPTSQQLRVGRCLNNNDPLRSSPIDEVAVWNSLLSDANIGLIYNSGSPADLTAKSPSIWWRMGDGDTFPVLSDSVGAIDLTLQNATAAAIVTDTP